MVLKTVGLFFVRTSLTFKLNWETLQLISRVQNKLQNLN